MNIGVIFTGGTIGSVQKENGIGPAGEGANVLLRQTAHTSTGETVQYRTVSPFTILSENSTGMTIAQLSGAVRQMLDEGWAEGIIVTHGTDTLAYSAAALGYLFGDSRIPIVLVSSNYVLQDARANGQDNFHYAVEFLAWAKEHPGKAEGVFVSYRNTGQDPVIHCGTAVLAHQAYTDSAYSVQDQAFGWFDGENGFRYNDIWEKMAGEQEPSVPCPLHAPSAWDAPILQIIPSPGMRYPTLTGETKAVLHHSYHAGTICSDSPDAAEFFEIARAKNIPVFLCGADPDMVYESTASYRSYGIRLLPKASPVAMYMKLWLLLDNRLDPEIWMQRKLFGDRWL